MVLGPLLVRSANFYGIGSPVSKESQLLWYWAPLLVRRANFYGIGSPVSKECQRVWYWVPC